jgi:hypothetical protein
MISQRQLAANRRNAAKSHGPKTPEGRAAVRLNALKHGFTAAEIILPTVEAEADFEAFRQAFEDKCQPVGPIEEVLVEDIVISRWRLSRIRKMEPGFFAKKLQNLKAIREEHYSHLSGYAHLTHVLADDALYQDVYGKMSRYEGRFQRTFFKALKELERLQAPPRLTVRFREWDCFAKSDFTRSRTANRAAYSTTIAANRTVFIVPHTNIPAPSVRTRAPRRHPCPNPAA